ncbi:hypothetical protein KP509_04G076200 [Ceratopteris richardii]|nr:hypothetical protein KP509_04G076200 [Ceratopteris richardii]
MNTSIPSKHPGLPKWPTLALLSTARVITMLVGCLFNTQRRAEHLAPSKHPGLPKWHSLSSHSVAQVITTLVGWLFDSQRRIRTLLVNKMGCSVVLRSKFRNVWEGTPLTLSAGDQAFLLCTPQMPHQRVGVFLYDPLPCLCVASCEVQQRAYLMSQRSQRACIWNLSKESKGLHTCVPQEFKKVSHPLHASTKHFCNRLFTSSWKSI